MSKLFLLVFIALSQRVQSFGIGSTLYCYQCVSTQPGCSPFNWFWHWSQACPEDGDTCVKVIERKGASEVVTRDCLSALKGVRTDIPADHYEGCKPAAVDVKLGNYVFSSIKELDVKKDYYDETTFCFCSFDNRCNGSSSLKVNKSVMFSLTALFMVIHFLILR
ncbi:uncharacterized protein LOC106663402 [Cimex lectularius]|uniref:Protein sleepless n=1 Tax=Cimex lectularius TaxID=79782 RepID=A0A8I6TCF2_CIMLE|nr:uncharacterized protein LOC106663402 [Cimex lectularius]